MIKYLIIVVVTLLSFQMKAQTWVAPAGGFYNNQLYYNLYADEDNNSLYRFGSDTNVLHNNAWHTWYLNTNILGYTSAPIHFTDHKNYFFKQYLENNNPLQKRSALVRWTNGTDLDTVKVYNGTIGICCQTIHSGKFYVSVQHDTIGFKSYIAEFDGMNLSNLMFDTIWKGNQYKGIGSTINYKGDLYAIGGFYNNHKIIVYKDNQWQPFSQWKGNDNGVIVKMLIYNDRLYFIGGFWKTENPTTPGNSVIAWNGQNWDDLGGGIEHSGLYLQGGANDAVVCNNKIYFVGPFDHAGGLKASKVVTWNDTNWCAVGGDLDSSFTISQIECFKDTVYIEGNLSNVHGVNLGTIGKMQNMNYTDSCRQVFTSIRKYDHLLSNISVEPNPTSSLVRIKYDEPEPIIRLVLSNLLGQQIFEILEPQELELNISQYSRGIYYLNIQTKHGQISFKILKE